MSYKPIKKALALVMAFIIAVAIPDASWATEENSDTVVADGITDGQIVAETYKESLGLTEQETAILNSQSIAGEYIKVSEPKATDGLITVDSDNKTIEAKDYTDEYGNSWIGEQATVIFSDGTEVVDLEDGKGKFSYAGRNYSVEVNYVCHKHVDNQPQLVNTPYYLAKGIENMEILVQDSSTYLMLMESIAPEMMILVDGTLPVKLQEGTDASNAIYWFNDQIEKNGVLDLTTYIEEYNAAESKLKYILENGEKIKACVIETYDNAKAIAEAQGIKTILTFAGYAGGYETEIAMLNRALKQYALLADSLHPVYDDDWKLLDLELLSDNPDYSELDALAEAAIGNSSLHVVVEKNPLKVSETVISSNVNSYNVTVNMYANVIPSNQVDSNELGSLEVISKVITLPEDTPVEEILAAIEESGIEAYAIESWDYGIDEENYIRNVSELTDKLTEDISYSIRYTPKMCELSFEYDETQNKTVYYGYNHSLEVAADIEKSYDYSINGVSYLQGEIYRVVGDTEISRTEGKARETFRFSDIAAEDYADTLTDKEIDILTQKALLSETISLRVADNEDEDRIIIDGQTITAKDYESGVEGLTWKPLFANVIKDEQSVEAKFFVNNTAELETVYYDYADVDYQLILRSGNNTAVRELLNLPGVLVSQAEAQKEDLYQLAYTEVYTNLGNINLAMLNAMGGNLGAESKAAIEVIKEETFNSETGKFYLYEYMTAYRASGLTYYYQDGNYAKIKEQVGILAEQLAIVAEDEQLIPLLNDLGYGAYKDKIDTVVTYLDEMKDGFSAPHSAIDTGSPKLSDLVEAIEKEGTTNSYDTVNGLRMNTILREAAENVVFVNINVSVLDGQGLVEHAESAGFAFDKGAVIEDNSRLYASLAEMEEKLNIDKENYTCEIKVAIPENGHIMAKTVNVSYVWTPKKFSVSIEGTDIVIPFSYDDTEIALPLCDEANYVYIYSIAGKEFEASVNDNTFEFLEAFTREEFMLLFSDSSNLVITRIKSDVNRNDVNALIDSLNVALSDAGQADGSGNLNMAFIPIDRNGKLELVLRISINDGLSTAITDALPVIAEELITSKYSYVELNGSTFIDKGVVSVQALIDMILANEGFGTDTVSSVIDSNGNINELVLDDATVIGAYNNSINLGKNQIQQVDLLGGQILTASLSLGKSSGLVNYQVPVYITVEDFDKKADTLLKARNLANEYDDLRIVCENQTLHIESELPDEVFSALLAPILINDTSYMEDITNVTLREMLDYDYGLIEPILKNGDVDAVTIKNTLEKQGISYDIDYISYILDIMRHLMDYAEIEGIESSHSSYRFDASYSLEALFEKAGVQDVVKNLFAEKDSGVLIPARITSGNMQKDYQAVIFGSDSVIFATDAGEKTSSAPAGSTVVLLSDIPGDIHFNNEATLNLNGKNINGSLTGSAVVKIVDNSVDADGTVYGSVSGNFDITAGKFASDVSALLPEGYTQENGKVKNIYYDIQKDKNGNYTVLIEPDFMNKSDTLELKNPVVEISVDLFERAYNKSSWIVDGVQVFNENVGEEEYFFAERIRPEAVEHMSNNLLYELTGFTGIIRALETGNAFASYDTTEIPWEYSLRVDGAAGDNIIVSDIVPATEQRQSTVSFKITGSREEKELLTELCIELERIVKINTLSISVEDISYAEGVYTAETFSNIDMTLDYSADDNYAVTLGIIAAGSMTDNTGILKALESALAGEGTELLVEELDKLTLSQIYTCLEAADGLSLKDMAKSLGLSDAATDSKYSEIWNMTYAGLKRLEIVPEEDSLASLKKEDSYADYSFERSDWNGMNVNVETVLCKEKEIVETTPTPTPSVMETPTASPTPTPSVTETLTPTPTVTETVTPTPEPTETETPTPSETVTPVPTETVTPTPGPLAVIKPAINLAQNRNLFFGGEIQDHIIYIDARSEGITAAQFIQNMVMFNVENGSLDHGKTYFLSGAESGYIVNGAVIQVVAVNASAVETVETYKIILKGDVNCDGKSNSTDAVLLTDYWLDYNGTVLNEDQLSAADMDKNGVWNNTDAVLMGDKFFGYEYVSGLAYH